MIIKRMFKTTVLAGTIAVSVATPALATIYEVNVDGGRWKYGTDSSYVISNYYHSGVCHGSTAVGVTTNRSANTAPGAWSYASAAKASSGNESFYRTHCN